MFVVESLDDARAEKYLYWQHRVDSMVTKNDTWDINVEKDSKYILFIL